MQDTFDTSAVLPIGVTEELLAETLSLKSIGGQLAVVTDPDDHSDPEDAADSTDLPEPASHDDALETSVQDHTEVDDIPTLSCSRCNRTWDLSYELDDLQVGNRAVERFALDHQRHTGHFPDEISCWVADCRQCPDTEQFLSERPARRFARTHARHTGHAVELAAPESESDTVEPSE